jgi:hypothetical protein
MDPGPHVGIGFSTGKTTALVMELHSILFSRPNTQVKPEKPMQYESARLSLKPWIQCLLLIHSEWAYSKFGIVF